MWGKTLDKAYGTEQMQSDVFKNKFNHFIIVNMVVLRGVNYQAMHFFILIYKQH